MKLTWARAACSHPALSGVSRAHFGELLDEIASPWAAARESALRDQRGGPRRRSVGAGRKPKLLLTDRLLVTLVHPRHGLAHAVLAEFFDVGRSTVSTAIRQVRNLLAARGFAVPDRRGLRLKTLEDVFATPRPRRSSCGWTGRRRRFGARRRAGPAAGHRLRQAQAEHNQDDDVQRRPRTHAVVRSRATGPYA
ncbi:transposase family protein [Streptomyces sp. NPDC057136]|uniref:helix-turn-helix domain-containing protein n=1 Tax=Streptomyces sp. NPDC057136 TaxID=3346029 RepID=UPI003643B5EA